MNLKRKLQRTIITMMFVLLCVAGTKSVVSAATGTVDYGTVYTVEAEENGDASLLYEMNVPTSGKVTMTFAFTQGQYIWTSVTLQIVDTAGNILGEIKVDGSNTQAIQSFDLVSGDYEIKFVSSGGSIHNSFIASFKAEFTSANETIQDSVLDKHDSILTAAEYPNMDATITGHFALNDNTDVYKIDITSSGIYNITLANTQIKSMNLSLVDSYGEYNYEQNNIGVGTQKYVLPLVKGTYYLTLTDNNVKDSTGTYSLTTKINDVPTVKLSSVKNSSKNAAKVAWKRNSSVEGYQVQISTNSKFKKGVKKSLITNKATSKKVFIKLKKGKKYYARVRTYVTTADGNKIYSKWSNVKSVKIKK